ncbi:hypothetical protein EVAR_34042_1 [Eumeta japonica]|uniref:Uncharacterized protein n=1 Tax=Eumeta variegata TaxID=151549 RepID=A0A4C1VTU1_EUMVA|nr:hypothetical protein EVAR_34042_1 [Eumeta japonica]
MARQHIRVGQLNLQGTKLASVRLQEIARERDLHVIMVQEQYQGTNVDGTNALILSALLYDDEMARDTEHHRQIRFAAGVPPSELSATPLDSVPTPRRPGAPALAPRDLTDSYPPASLFENVRTIHSDGTAAYRSF